MTTTPSPAPFTRAAPTPAHRWSGEWVAQQLDVRLDTTGAPLGVPLAALLGLALRRNPRRAHLLVSRVLGKHVPADPRLVHGAGLLLGELVRRRLLDGTPVPARLGTLLAEALADPHGDVAARAGAALPDAVHAVRQDLPASASVVVLGYAETATALGHCVADALGTASCLHSTRRSVPGFPTAGGFQEEHSHATSHLVLPGDDVDVARAGTVVLVDDELSTGTTALNTIAALQARSRRGRYVVATLADLRSDDDRARAEAAAEAMDVRLDVVALAAGRLLAPDDLLDRGRELVEAVGPPEGRAIGRTPGRVRRVDIGWPDTLPESGRHGFTPADRLLLETELPRMADVLVEALSRSTTRRVGRLLVLGHEELMYAPLRLATAVADRLDPSGAGDLSVRFSTTTRSPVVPVDDTGYAIRTALTFTASDTPADAPGPRFAYNVAPRGDGSAGFDAVVLVVDRRADNRSLAAPDGLIDRLAGVADDVIVVTLPDAARLVHGRRGAA